MYGLSDVKIELANYVAASSSCKNASFDKQFGVKRIELTAKDPARPNSGVEYFAFEGSSAQDTGKAAYNRTKTQDLLDRGDSIIDSLIDFYKAKSPVAEEKIAYLEAQRKAFYAYVKNTKIEIKFNKPVALALDIDAERARKRFSQKQKDKYVAAIVKATDNYIGKMLQDIAMHIKTSNETSYQALQRIREIEVKFHARNGRPTYLSQFTIAAQQGLLEQPLTMVSMQKPIGYYTDKQMHHMQQQGIFPTTREFTHTSKTRNGEGIANFVESAWGHFDQKTNQFVTDCSLLRGSWIPLDIKSEVRRRAVGLRALQQEFEYLANKQLTGMTDSQKSALLNNNSLKQPLVIPLSSMTLLSVLGKLDIFDPDHQYKIVLDNHIVKGMARSEPFEITLRDGQKLYVKADINEMAMGVNASRYERVSHPLQTTINNRGYNDWIEKVYAGLLERIAELPDSETVKQVKSLLQQDWELNDIKLTIKSKENNLNKLYVKLNQFYAENELKPEKELDKVYYKKLLKNIEEAENALDKVHQQLLEGRKKIWQESDELREKLIGILQAECKKLKNPGQKAAQQDFVDMLGQLSDAEELFFTKRFYAENPADNFQFQQKYIHLNAKLKLNPHASCKSSEDRTGELENRVMEMQAVKAATGYYPRSHSKIQNKDNNYLQNVSRHIGKFIHEFAASTANTAFNAKGARGLQLQDKSSWWQKLVFGGKGNNTGYKANKEALRLSKREKGFFKESMLTKLVRKVIPFVAPKLTVMSWKIWFEDTQANFRIWLKGKKKNVLPQSTTNLHLYQQVMTHTQFETVLEDALSKESISQLTLVQRRIKLQVSQQLLRYHQTIAALVQHNPIDIVKCWEALVELKIAVGNQLLELTMNEQARNPLPHNAGVASKVAHHPLCPITTILYQVDHRLDKLARELYQQLSGAKKSTAENESVIKEQTAGKAVNSYEAALQKYRLRQAERNVVPAGGSKILKKV